MAIFKAQVVKPKKPEAPKEAPKVTEAPKEAPKTPKD